MVDLKGTLKYIPQHLATKKTKDATPRDPAMAYSASHALCGWETVINVADGDVIAIARRAIGCGDLMNFVKKSLDGCEMTPEQLCFKKALCFLV